MSQPGIVSEKIEPEPPDREIRTAFVLLGEEIRNTSVTQRDWFDWRRQIWVSEAISAYLAALSWVSWGSRYLLPTSGFCPPDNAANFLRWQFHIWQHESWQDGFGKACFETGNFSG